MTTAATRPDELLGRLLTDDPARPRLTWYAGPERIELSGRVLGNWVSKAANLLADDLDVGVGVGATVAIDLPAHWRACYWALATWSLGATLVVGDHDADVRVAVAGAPMPDVCTPDLVAVTLAALARGSGVDLPPGAIDEAAVLATYGDVFSPWGRADDATRALVADAGSWSYTDVVPAGTPAGSRILLVGDDLVATLRAAAGAWASGGSVVLLDAEWAREGGAELIARIRDQEAVGD